MESPSAPAHRGRVPWQGLLLAVSLLTFWSPPTTAQLTVASINATEGENVLLLVHNVPENLIGYSWYRGQSMDNTRVIATYTIQSQKFTPGPLYSGRETIHPNGSLLLQKVTLNDTGYYTMQATQETLLGDKATGQLRVYPELPKPNITSNNSNPEEHKDSVLLTCESHTEDTTYLWLINSQSLQDSARLELSKDNRTLTLLHVTRNDTGPYECETRNPVSANHSDPYILNVLYGPDAPSILPSDSHYSAGANLRLSCHEASNPPAQYIWLINGRPLQLTQELFIPSITANDSGSYTCIAHNSVTGLNRTTVRTITVYEHVGKPFIRVRNTAVTEQDTVVLTCLTNDTGISIWWFFRDQSLLLTERTKLSWDNSTLIIEPVRREDAGSYQCEVSNSVSASKSDPLRLDVQTENDYTGYPVGTIAGIVIGVLVLVALGTAQGCFMYHRRTRRASDKRDVTEHRPPASTPGQGPCGASASLGPLPSPRTAGPIYEDLLHPSTDVYCRVSPRADGAS